MYAIAYKNHPATLQTLYRVDGKELRDQNMRDSFLTGKFKKTVIDEYIHYFGFTWGERPAGIDVVKLKAA